MNKIDFTTPAEMIKVKEIRDRFAVEIKKINENFGDVEKIKKYVSDFANPTTAGQEGVIVIPHLGASTEESEDNCAIMAVDETKKFIEQGSIINSVNFGRLDAGELTTVNRVLVCSKGVEIKDIGVKAESVKSVMRGEFGYSVIDTNEAVEEETVKTIAGVTKVRVIKK